MLKQQIRTTKLVDPGSHFSQAVAVPSKGVMVFVSGMTARRPDGTIAGIGDVEAQTRQVCENIKSA
ncbi:MAG TPA: Rid family hydrolase, partial [Burkholderiales bacterium]|nr:Rid family hydrolase [Burkholderiales bacterium]